MSTTRILDGPDRAELLCFLVLAQLIGHASTGDWLRTGDPNMGGIK